MPTRLIREGILTSERVEQLDAPAEVFYRRLMSKVDDHGLYDGRVSILRSSLYPLRVDRVREADISRSIAACEKAGLIALYQHDGKPFLQMMDTRWETRSKPKYPPPNGCEQLQTPVPLFGVVDVVVIEPTVLVAGTAYRPPPCPSVEIVEMYRNRLPQLPGVDVLNDSRKRAISARWREVCVDSKFTLQQGLEWFDWFFTHVGKSRFLIGKTKDWKADIDFLMTASKFPRVIEGAYHKDAA